MSGIAFFIGPERPLAHFPVEDPSSTLRLAALAASWTASRGERLLVLGDAPALLSVGTAVLGLQQSRVLEGGERRPSPIRVLALLESGNPDLDHSLSFQRRARERPFDDEQRQRFEEEPRPRDVFGDLSLLMDVGVMDLVGKSQRSLMPTSSEEVAESLPRLLSNERPRGVLAWVKFPLPLSGSPASTHTTCGFPSPPS